MKTKLLLFLTSVGIISLIDVFFFKPAGTIVQNVATVNVVNGGDSAYVAQQAALTLNHEGVLMVLTLILFVLFYGKSIINLFSQKTNN